LAAAPHLEREHFLSRYRRDFERPVFSIVYPTWNCFSIARFAARFLVSFFGTVAYRTESTWRCFIEWFSTQTVEPTTLEL
jgi:hypothetical protein